MTYFTQNILGKGKRGRESKRKERVRKKGKNNEEERENIPQLIWIPHKLYVKEQDKDNMRKEN